MKGLDGKIVDIQGTLGVIRQTYEDRVVIERFPFQNRVEMPIGSLQRNHIIKRLFTGCDFTVSAGGLERQF
jgi:hypothetical protein